jgi:hypothetical protein
MTERAEDFNLALKQLHRLLVAHELVLLDFCSAKAGPSQVVSAGDQVRESKTRGAPLMATSSPVSRFMPRLTSANVPEPIFSLRRKPSSAVSFHRSQPREHLARHEPNVVLLKDLAPLEHSLRDAAEHEPDAGARAGLGALGGGGRLSRRWLLAERDVVAVSKDATLVRNEALTCERRRGGQMGGVRVYESVSAL